MSSDHTDAPSDRNFDGLAHRFRRTVYDSPRGRLRLRALQQDFIDLAIPLHQAQVLDVGGGQGQFALWLARQGARIDLCDISTKMLELARQAFTELGLDADLRHCALQDIDRVYERRFDIVLNHAVLEWLGTPLEAIAPLADRVAPNGVLSLMFYNRAGHQWRQIMNGRVTAPDDANPRLLKEGNTPQNPLQADEVFARLETCGLDILRWRGIRCVHDHMHQTIRTRLGEDRIAQADLYYGLIDPFRQLGRYIHVLARRPEN
jgi:S-adenosylmethionine-dependent methyltransferase